MKARVLISAVAAVGLLCSPSVGQQLASAPSAGELNIYVDDIKLTWPEQAEKD